MRQWDFALSAAFLICGGLLATSVSAETATGEESAAHVEAPTGHVTIEEIAAQIKAHIDAESAHRKCRTPFLFGENARTGR